MSTQEAKDRLERPQRTVDLGILRTLIFRSQHGRGIARALQQTSGQEFPVEYGELYPAPSGSKSGVGFPPDGEPQQITARRGSIPKPQLAVNSE